MSNLPFYLEKQMRGFAHFLFFLNFLKIHGNFPAFSMKSGFSHRRRIDVPAHIFCYRLTISQTPFNPLNFNAHLTPVNRSFCKSSLNKVRNMEYSSLYGVAIPERALCRFHNHPILLEHSSQDFQTLLRYFQQNHAGKFIFTASFQHSAQNYIPPPTAQFRNLIHREL